MVKERPILFSAPMVRAILAGTKTQTRRTVKFPSWVDRVERVGDWFTGEGMHPAGECGHPKCAHIGGIVGGGGPSLFTLQCPYGKPGDKLWVREAWRACVIFDALSPAKFDCDPIDFCGIVYEADGFSKDALQPTTLGRYRQALFMPRWASRITLEVTEVRVQRLQEISEEDAIAEGITDDASDGSLLIADYHTLWESINGPGSWDTNPWVWCISFKRV